MKKLKLEDLKVNSFITNLDGSNQNTVQGGSSPVCYVVGVVVSYFCGKAMDAIDQRGVPPNTDIINQNHTRFLPGNYGC